MNMSALRDRLPEYERLIFKNSPLDEVVCQLRFNDILQIGHELSPAFHDEVRQDYPRFGREHGVKIGATGNKPLVSAQQGAWQLKSEDGDWLLSVASNFIALKTDRYVDFADYWQRFKPVVKAFIQEYDIPYFVRVGLRYVNSVVLPRDNNSSIDWSHYFNDHLAGHYGDEMLRSSLVEGNHQLLLEHDNGQIGLRYARHVGEASGKEAERFTVDLDCFGSGQIPPEQVEDLLADYNILTYRLFVWCLTPAGREYFEPVESSQENKEGDNG